MQRRRACFALLALASLPAVAQPKHGHAHDHKPKHGGVIRESGGFVYELLATPASIRLWVTDEADKPVETRGSTARVTLISDAKTRVEVALAPGGGNLHEATGTFPVKPGATAFLEVAVGGKAVAKLRYVLK